MGIELVHSHHGWVDVNVCNFLEHNRNADLIVTTHGMYETIPPAELAQILPLLEKRVGKFVYVADKNLVPFTSNSFDMTRFVKIDNASDLVSISPVPRAEINVPENAFLLCWSAGRFPKRDGRRLSKR